MPKMKNIRLSTRRHQTSEGRGLRSLFRGLVPEFPTVLLALAPNLRPRSTMCHMPPCAPEETPPGHPYAGVPSCKEARGAEGQRGTEEEDRGWGAGGQTATEGRGGIEVPRDFQTADLGQLKTKFGVCCLAQQNAGAGCIALGGPGDTQISGHFCCNTLHGFELKCLHFWRFEDDIATMTCLVCQCSSFVRFAALDFATRDRSKVPIAMNSPAL